MLGTLAVVESEKERYSAQEKRGGGNSIAPAANIAASNWTKDGKRENLHESSSYVLEHWLTQSNVCKLSQGQ